MSYQKVLLWEGCAYRNQLSEELNSIKRVLNKLKIPLSYVEENCCGYPLFLAGYIKEFKELAIKNSKILSSFQLVVTACPACFRSFKELYRDHFQLKFPPILHLTQFLVEKISENNLTKEDLKPIGMKIMYHDPCELGREMGIYDEPRRLLELVPGLVLFEKRFIKESSTCCGGGGLLPNFSPSIASLAAARKLTQEDMVPMDLDAVVTTCPQCILNLRRGLEIWVEDESLKNIRVLDLTQILDKALGD